MIWRLSHFAAEGILRLRTVFQYLDECRFDEWRGQIALYDPKQENSCRISRPHPLQQALLKPTSHVYYVLQTILNKSKRRHYGQLQISIQVHWEFIYGALKRDFCIAHIEGHAVKMI